LLLILAGVGYLLVTLPPTVIEQYERAAGLSPTWGYVYLAAVGLGGTILVGVLGWIVFRVLLNSRRKSKQRGRRVRDPSQLSPAEREAELRENLAAGGDYAAGDEVSDEIRGQLRTEIKALEAKLDHERLEIVAFGTISSGKSSLLNALAGRDLFRTDPRGGTTVTRCDVPWPGGDEVVLVDTPGLAEVQGETRAAESAAAAQDADLVLLVVDGPLKAYEMDLLRRLGAMEKRVLACLNKEDWFSDEDRQELLAQIRQQVEPIIHSDDLVAVRSRTVEQRRVRVLPDGSETEETATLPADIEPLAGRMLQIVEHDRRDLLLSNLLLQSRGLVESAKDRVRASLDARADEIVSRYMWAAGGVTAANPLPLLDLAGGSAVTVKMVLELARVYRQPIDADTVVTLLAQLTKNLVGMLGVAAATPAITTLLGSMLKTVPGVGTIAGGLLQGLTQSLLTRWIGKVFCAYFRNEMKAPPGGLSEIARDKWAEVTAAGELTKMIQAGRRHLLPEGGKSK
jgi:hypothetical protein